MSLDQEYANGATLHAGEEVWVPDDVHCYVLGKAVSVEGSKVPSPRFTAAEG